MSKNAGRKPKIAIGRDTRISGGMLECAIAAGVCAGGCDAALCGVAPTPAVAYLARECGHDAGIMISASHNLAFDNGIKIFGPQGFKLSDELEEEIERAVDDCEGIELRTGEHIGTVTRDFDAIDKYAEHIAKIGKTTGGGRDIRVLIDCANGSASRTAEKIFGGEGASWTIMNASPDGLNINDGCGSTHMEGIMGRMKAGEIFGAMKPCPQVTVNVKVENEMKKEIMADAAVLEAAERAKRLLDGNGRVLLRPSGTESLVRIMVEGESQGIVAECAKEIEKAIMEKLKIWGGDKI